MSSDCAPRRSSIAPRTSTLLLCKSAYTSSTRYLPCSTFVNRREDWPRKFTSSQDQARIPVGYEGYPKKCTKCRKKSMNCPFFRRPELTAHIPKVYFDFGTDIVYIACQLEAASDFLDNLNVCTTRIKKLAVEAPNFDVNGIGNGVVQAPVQLPVVTGIPCSEFLLQCFPEVEFIFALALHGFDIKEHPQYDVTIAPASTNLAAGQTCQCCDAHNSGKWRDWVRDVSDLYAAHGLFRPAIKFASPYAQHPRTGDGRGPEP